MSVDTSINWRFISFFQGHRFDRTNFFKALYELSILDNESRDQCWLELKTHTYTGTVFLSETIPHNYTVRIENASGYTEYLAKDVSLSWLVDNLNLDTDREAANFGTIFDKNRKEQ